VPRTQASLAVSGDGEDWFLINASPDLRQQIEARPILHPRRDRRSSPIESVILTGADVDAIAGLLHLRERQSFTICAGARVLAVLAANPTDPFRKNPGWRRAGAALRGAGASALAPRAGQAQGKSAQNRRANVARPVSSYRPFRRRPRPSSRHELLPPCRIYTQLTGICSSPD